MTQEAVTLVPVGVVRSAYTEIEDRDWRAVEAEIHVDESLVDGLRGLEEWSHIVIIFYLHRSRFDPKADMVRHPMDREDMPRRGFLATRSNYRFNPLGLTTVELLAVEGSMLKVRGLDALDGTLVLDIKPHAPGFDCPEGFVAPAWYARLQDDG